MTCMRLSHHEDRPAHDPRMTRDLEQTVNDATSGLLSAGVLGLLRVDAHARVVERRGRLVDWVALAPVADSLPFLVGYEDVLDALRGGAVTDFTLPNVAVGCSGRDAAPVFDVRLFAGAQPGDVVVVVQDVSAAAVLEQRVVQTRNELALAQRALVRARQEAEAANAAKSAFLNMVSHDLRTPLNVIMGNAEILGDEVGRLPEIEYMRPFVEDVRDNGRYLLDLITDLLDVARGEAGMLDLDLEMVAPADAVDEALRLVTALPAAADLLMAAAVAPGVPAIAADRRRLKQVLVNLLGNAVKFTPPGGRIDVTVDTDGDATVRISVADTGIGIAEGDLEHVLRPFGRAHGPRRGGADVGTGLGLPLARLLVEGHGGRLTLASAEGAGTTVTVILPAGGRGGPAAP